MMSDEATNNADPVKEPAAEPTSEAPAEAPLEEAPKEPTTVLDSEPAKEVSVPADWPEDWREKIAGGDDKLLNELKRTTSPEAWGKRFLSLRQKASEAPSPFPAEGSDEDKAKWRKANNIPQEAKGYLEGLPTDVKIPEHDQAFVDRIVGAAHEINADPGTVQSMIQAYYTMEAETDQALRELNDQTLGETNDALHAEWGPDYRPNIGTLKTWLSKLPDGVGEMIEQARGADGLPLLSNVSFVRAFADMARKEMPFHKVVPGTSGDPMQSINDEIADIEAKMQDQRSEYHHGPKDANGETRMANRYIELVEARDRMKAQAS